MFMEDQYTKFVDERFPRNDHIRRIENGSIDYDHYLKIGREVRGTEFRNTFRSSKGLFQRIFDTVTVWRRASQEVEQSAATFVLVAQAKQHGDEGRKSDGRADQSFSEAA